MLHAGDVFMNRYEIVREIGQGGMSVVYQAKDLANNRIVAIKKVKRSGKAKNQAVEQILNAEGRMLMQLSNPHLTKIHDIVEEKESFLLVMDFVDGESLDKILAREGAQPMDRVLDWGMQICEVFDYLHNQQTPIIYRDMKPANVMRKPDGRLMMIDFGTARTEKQGIQMRADTMCLGTEGFAAPEQFGGFGQSTARTDIFCLGATLYNMITGHSPCDPPKGIRPLGEWSPELGNTPLAEIIAKCTRNDPDERYQTAMELYEDLRQARLGIYKMKRSKSGLSGALKKPDWQRQDVQGKGLLSSGLSGLLHRGKTGSTAQQNNRNNGYQDPYPTILTGGKGWQQVQTQGEIQNDQQIQMDYDQEEQPENLLLSQLVTIGLAIAVIFVLLTVVLAVMKIYVAAVVFLLIALAASVMAIVCMVLQNRQ